MIRPTHARWVAAGRSGVVCLAGGDEHYELLRVMVTCRERSFPHLFTLLAINSCHSQLTLNPLSYLLHFN